MMPGKRDQGVGTPTAAGWLAALLLIGLPQAAIAQSATPGIASSADCARQPSKDQEIACLRQALEQSRRALEGNAATPVDHSPAAPVEAPAAAATPSPAIPARPPELGAEQVVTRSRDRSAAKPPSKVLRAVVVHATADARGVLTLGLDNGQVWREKEQPSVPLRLDERGTYPVEISRSGFGGYRMRFPERNRTIVVERIS